VAGVSVLLNVAATRGELRLIAEHPELVSRSYESMAAHRERVQVYEISARVGQEAAGYLPAASMETTFEAWMRWVPGRDPDRMPYLVTAVGVLGVPVEADSGRCQVPASAALYR
jgi:hypothetical protein